MGIVMSALVFYLGQPIILGNRSTPIPVALNGTLFLSLDIFLTLYFLQMIHGTCVVIAIVSYDSIFIQFTMQLMVQYTIMIKTLNLLLSDCLKVTPNRQRDILVHVLKCHMNVLR